jgi:hypothetical protein
MMTSGERLPVLLDSVGQPLFGPTVYSLTELRARNRAANTIGNALRALLVFYLFLDLQKIDLGMRLDAGQLLALGEIEDLVRLCRFPVEKLSLMLDEAETKRGPAPVLSIEKHRMRLGVIAEEEIVPASAATRLRCIRDYLGWLATDCLFRHGADKTYRATLESAGQFVANAINARLPSGGQSRPTRAA